MRAVIGKLPGGRLHLSDGPIDLVVEAFGPTAEVRAAYEATARRFLSILDELCAELPLLRRASGEAPQGSTARRMWHAVAPFAGTTFVTPMAAVAGAVADEILAAMAAAAKLDRACVNNGGDIALHLNAGQSLTAGLVDRPDAPSLFGRAHLTATSPVRGIATSGWRGRSFSLGIADAVTVLGASAAQADAAATLIANAVDLPGHPAIRRVPASEIAPDSDLGERPVTRAVGALSAREVGHALASGCAVADDFLQQRLIHAAALHLSGSTRVVGSVQAPAMLLGPNPRARRAASRWQATVVSDPIHGAEATR